MASSSSTATILADNPRAHAFPGEVAQLTGGLVRHHLVSASTQVRILSIIDETGSATVGDILAALPDHPDPVEAVLVMVQLTILELEIRGVLDANTVVRRADPEPVGPESAPDAPAPIGDNGVAAEKSDQSKLAAGLEQLQVSPFQPYLVVGDGHSRRLFAKDEKLNRPGIYGFLSSTSLYAGMGGIAGVRVGSGPRPIEKVETVFVVVEANGNMTEDDALVVERIFWSRVAASRELQPTHEQPLGASVDAQRYTELEVFVSEICLALRHAGILFLGGPARQVLAGPRCEPGRASSIRFPDTAAEGEVMELSFSGGLTATAVREADDRWVLLAGSEVRVETVPSANSSVRFLRSAWLHSGILAASADERSYRVTRNMVFSSGSAVSHFCSGSKGLGLSAWRSVDPDGGYDPETAALIAA